MKENIKIGLLAIIAIATLGTFLMEMNNGDSSDIDEAESAAVAANVNNLHANGTQNLNPNAHNNPNPEPIQQTLNTPPEQLNTPPAPQAPPTKITFSKMQYDFGTIKQNSTNNQYKFEFTNTGDKPLIISNAAGSCGCTVPNWPKEPIMPGKKGVIDVDYKPGVQEGKQEKTVTVTANTEPVNTILKINANVLK
jgi:hypothetical protein